MKDMNNKNKLQQSEIIELQYRSTESCNKLTPRINNKRETIEIKFLSLVHTMTSSKINGG